MKIVPLATESLGVRSMATYVETDRGIFIDPGLSVVPLRYGRSPHKLEIKQERYLWSLIKKYLEKSEIVIITHYHYDHHNPDEVEVMSDKKLLIKDPENNINFSQKKRAAYFLEKIKGITDSISIADGMNFRYGETVIEFSPPLPHGEDTQRGYVIEVSIEYRKEKFLFTSDVQGPAIKEQKDFIIDMKPSHVYIDGPPTYLLDIYYDRTHIERCLRNIVDVAERDDIKTVVVDHHFMRDKDYQRYLDEINNNKIMPVSTYLGLPSPINLEAERKNVDSKSMELRIEKLKKILKEI